MITRNYLRKAPPRPATGPGLHVVGSGSADEYVLTLRSRAKARRVRLVEPGGADTGRYCAQRAAQADEPLHIVGHDDRLGGGHESLGFGCCTSRHAGIRRRPSCCDCSVLAMFLASDRASFINGVVMSLNRGQAARY